MFMLPHTCSTPQMSTRIGREAKCWRSCRRAMISTRSSWRTARLGSRARFQSGKPGPSQKHRGGRKTTHVAMEAARTGIVAKRQEMNEFHKFHGNIWPVALYKEVEGKLPAKKSIKTYDVGGQKIRGVLRKRSAGSPHGVVEWWKTSRTGVELAGDLANADTHTQEEVEEVFEKACKRQRVTTTEVQQKEGEEADGCLKVAASETKDGDDAGDDDQILASIWGSRWSRSRADKRDNDGGDQEDDDAKSMKGGEDTSTPVKGQRGRGGGRGAGGRGAMGAVPTTARVSPEPQMRHGFGEVIEQQAELGCRRAGRLRLRTDV